MALRLGLLLGVVLAAPTVTSWTFSELDLASQYAEAQGVPVAMPTPSAVPTSTATATVSTATEPAGVPVPTATSGVSILPTPTDTAAASTATASATSMATATTTPIATATPIPIDTGSLPPLAPTPEAVGRSDDAVIDSSGGSIASADGRVQVLVPPAVLTEPLDVKISKLDEHAQVRPPSTLTFVGAWRFDALAVNRADAAVHTFPGDVTLVLHFTPEDLSGLLPQSLTLWTFDEAAQQWVRVPSQLDLPNLVLAAQVNHFTDYAATSTNIVNSAPMLDSRNVDLHSGSASFGVPIQIPAGVGGLTPDLSLSYDSGRIGDMHNYDQGTSWAGIGWDLDVPHVQVSYVPNSSPRVFLSLGNSGGEIMPDPGAAQDPAGWYVWRARNEQFVRIRTSCTTFNCPWMVTDQKGTQYVFGSDVTPSATSPAYGRWYFDQSSPYARHYYRFDLAYETDVLGHRIDYSYWYQTIGDPARWTEYPQPQYVAAGYVSQITYNGGAASITFNSGDFVNSWTGHQIYDVCYTEEGWQPDYDCSRSDTPKSPLLNCPYFAPLVAETRRLTDIEVYAGGQLARTYLLSYNTDNYPNNHDNKFILDPDTCLTVNNEGTNRLNSVSLFGNDAANPGAKPLYTMSFLYQALNSAYCACGWYGNSYYTWPYLVSATNGFGGSDGFTYQGLGEGVAAQFSRQVVVQERHVAGLGEPDMVTKYSYENGPKQWNWSNPYTQTLDTFDSEYRGFGTVTERQLDAAGKTLSQTQHMYWTNTDNTWPPEVLTGHEYYTLTTDAGGSHLQETSTTWASAAVSNPRTGGGNFVNFVYPAEIDNTAGNGPTAMTDYTVNAFDVGNGTGMDTGNITQVEQYAGAAPNGTKQLSTVTHYQRNHTAWIVVPQDAQTFDGQDALLSFTRNYYDGANTSTPATPPVHGLLTATSGQICGPAPASTLCPGNPAYSMWSSSYSVYDADGRQVQASAPTSINPESQSSGSSLGWLPPPPLVVPSTLAHYNAATHTAPDWTQNALGQQTSYVYDWSRDLLTQATDPNGYVTAMDYDVYGRLLHVYDNFNSTSPNVLLRSFEYSWGGAPNRTVEKDYTDNSGGDFRTIVSCADGFGREVDHRQTYLDTSFGVMFNSVRTDYDTRGLKAVRTNPVSTGSSAGCETNPGPVSARDRMTFAYDALGNAATTTFLAANQATGPSAVASVNGTTSTACDENFNTTKQVRDPVNRLVTTYDPPTARQTSCGSVGSDHTVSTFDALGRLIQVTDQAGNETHLTYDMAGRKLDMRDPDMGHWRYSYDAAGNLATQTDARGYQTTLSYDWLNRPLSKTYTGVTPPDGGTPPTVTDPSISMTYDAVTGVCGIVGASAIGHLSQWSDANGTGYSCFDPRGRNVFSDRRVSDPFQGYIERFVQRSFDTLGNVTQLVYPDGETAFFTYGSGNDTGQLSSVSTLLNGSGQSQSPIVSQAYATPWGAPGGFALGDRGANPNVLTTRFGYDSRMRLTDLRTGSSLTPAVAQHLALTYDDAGNVTAVTDKTTGEFDAYTYDGLNRLGGSPTTPAMTINGKAAAFYTYNNIGNLTSKTESLSGMANSTNITSFTYPATGTPHPHAVVATAGTPSLYLAYDVAGNVCATSPTTLTAGCATAGVSTYGYDAENRLARRSDARSPGTSDMYAYDATGTLLKRTSYDGSYTVYFGGLYEETYSSSGTLTSVVKYFGAFGRAVAMRQTTNAMGADAGTFNYLLADHLGSTVGMTDSSGTVLSTQKYWPYGATRSGGVTQTDKLYTGQQIENGDSALGLYNYKARFYSTTLGRFVSADSTGSERFAYARNNPLAFTDPSGLTAEFSHELHRGGWRCFTANSHGGSLCEPALVSSNPLAPYVDQIRWWAAYYGVDPGAVIAIIRRENNKGSMQLFQEGVGYYILATAGRGAIDWIAEKLKGYEGAQLDWGPANVSLGLVDKMIAAGIDLPHLNDVDTVDLLRTMSGAIRYAAAALKYNESIARSYGVAGATAREHALAMYFEGESNYRLWYENGQYVGPVRGPDGVYRQQRGDIGGESVANLNELLPVVDEARSWASWCATVGPGCSQAAPP